MEVESAPLLRLEPALHFGTFVSAVVVHDQVHFLSAGSWLFEMIQEFDELAAAMAFLAGANHFAIENIECGEQSRRAII